MNHINALFNPRSIAVVGASHTPGKIGHTIVQNILDSGYKGAV
jgi:acyl-CoA synthetase (NDP forming)